MSDNPPKKKQSEERDDLVLTPGGWRSKSKVHKVEPGQHVEVQDGRLRVVDSASGEVVADLGEVGEEDAGTVRGGGAMKKAERPESTE